MKHGLVNSTETHQMSHPTRVRGLKLVRILGICLFPGVAPHAGAWIETALVPDEEVILEAVAPHAGAWIETRSR